MASKQGGKSKRTQSEKKKLARVGARRRAEQRHVRNARANETQYQANLQLPGPVAWQQARIERARRRAVLAAAWSAHPWTPGDALAREKSLREWTLAHRKDEPAPAS